MGRVNCGMVHTSLKYQFNSIYILVSLNSVLVFSCAEWAKCYMSTELLDKQQQQQNRFCKLYKQITLVLLSADSAESTSSDVLPSEFERTPREEKVTF